MAAYNVSFSKAFKRKIKKLSSIDHKSVQDKLLILKDNPRHPSLRTQKLHGESDLMESSINMDIRIVWYYGDNNNTIVLKDVGHHDILRKY